MKLRTSLLIIFSCSLLLGLYTNCGEGFVAMGDFASSNDDDILFSVTEKCSSVKRQAFSQGGFHNFLIANCKDCHSSGGAQGLFAASDINIAFATFDSFGWARISENAVDDNHPGPNNGPGLASQVTVLNSTWTQAQTVYNNCIKNTKKTGSGVFSLLTEEKRLNVNDEWQTLSWDLNKNQFTGNVAHSMALSFSIDIKNYYGEGELSTNPVGYLFRRPRLKFNGTENKVYVEGLQLLHDGVPVENFEVWTQLQVLIEKASEVKDEAPDSVLISDQQRQFALISDQINDINTLAVEFIQIIDNTGGINARFIPDEPNKIIVKKTKPVITDRVTYADLVGDGKYGVFKKFCYSCHSGNVNNGNFLIDNFATAKAKAARIKNRINRIDRPMPQSGLMNPFEIAVVERWIELKTPER